MEFRFNVNEYFKKPIVEIRNTLLPPDFVGDRRALWNTVNKVAEVVNEMGEASAHAQGLNKPITTAERLRQSDQSLYLLIDSEGNNGNGAVTGMLKVGKKGLYVFDREGQHYQVTPPCVLDFYVHEKRQRSGLGKKLFEYMLEKENVKPSNLAIDRPSDKFLNFLNKHYNLHSPVKQMNNYVVFDGFFPDGKKEEQTESSPINRTNGLQSAYANNSPSYGRYGAPRPPCSMGQIIHNTTSQKNSEPASLNNQQEHFSNQPQYQSNQVYQQNAAAQQQAYYPDQNNYQVPASNNSPQRFVNVSPTPHPIENIPQQRVFQQPQTYQQMSNSPQAQQQFPQYQQQYHVNPSIIPQSTEIVGRYDSTMPQQNNLDPNQRLPNVTPATPNIPQQNIPRQMQEMVYPQQNPGVMQSPPINHMAPQQQMIQDQVRMFPEKEAEARRIPYQNVQYAGNVQQNQNMVPSPGEYNNQPAGHIWPTQVQPQQVYQMSESIPQSQQNNVSFSQAPYAQPPQAQQFRPQQAGSQGNDVFVRSQQQPLSPEYALQTPQSAMPRDQQFTNAYEKNVQYQNLPAYQNNMPPNSIPEERYVPQQTYLRQPERSPYIIPQKSQPPNMEYNTQQKQIYQQQHQQNRPEQQQDKQENRTDETNQLKSETVQSLMQVDPKYFRPQPVQIKQPSETLMQTPPQVQRSYRQEETVDSLLRAEQEVFENGLLREKYRIPVRHHSANASQHLMTADHQRFCPHNHEGEIVGSDQVGYPPQIQQNTTHGQAQQYAEKRHYIPQEPLYDNRTQNYARQMPKHTHPEQPRTQYLPPPQQASSMPQQQYAAPAREHNQSQPQVNYNPQEQYLPQQIVSEQSYARYAPQTPAPRYAQQEFHQPEIPQNTDQYQSHQQFNQGQQRYEPIQAVPQEMFNPARSSAMEPQQVGGRPELEENRSNMPTYQEPNENREVAQYKTEISGNVAPVTNEPQSQQIGDKVDISTSGKVVQDTVESHVHFQENPRHSSFIPSNDFNPHAEGPGRKNPDLKTSASTDLPAQRKKRIDRQYGLNDADIRRKAYKSAIIRRTATTPRVNAESANHSPKLERPKSLEIQMENSVQESRSEAPIEEEAPEEEVDVVPTDDIEPEIEKLQINHDTSPSPGSGKRTPRHLTEQGYFDLKFYHNKLW